jgi:hypothetical protein
MDGCTGLEAAWLNILEVFSAEIGIFLLQFNADARRWIHEVTVTRPRPHEFTLKKLVYFLSPFQ